MELWIKQQIFLILQATIPFLLFCFLFSFPYKRFTMGALRGTVAVAKGLSLCILAFFVMNKFFTYWINYEFINLIFFTVIMITTLYIGGKIWLAPVKKFKT